MSRWSGIILARRAGDSPDDSEGTPWGEWSSVPSTAGIQVRVRGNRINGEGERDLYAWAYESKTQLPRTISFRYTVQPTREGPFDRLVSRTLPGEVVRGSVIRSTSGAVWIDALLIEEG